MEILIAKIVLYSDLPIFNSFEKEFGDRLLSLFPILKKISIKTFSMQQYKSAQENYIIQIKDPEKQHSRVLYIIIQELLRKLFVV